MIKTNKSGQRLYPFSSTENSRKLLVMYHKINARLQQLNAGDAERYPGEIDILKTNKTELDELTDLCTKPGIVYITGNILSRAKMWVERYDTETMENNTCVKSAKNLV